MSTPTAKFSTWLNEAKNNKSIAEPTAMALATADKNGAPSVRMVLLKDVDERGFVFYTNLDSRKSRELKENPKAGLCFFWQPLGRQVRVEGRIEPVSDAEADAYFASRARDSQIGAWSSKQSSVIANTGDLVKAVAANTAKFLGRAVPRPPFWSGWRVVPEKIEFWQQGIFRLHDRELYVRGGDGWQVEKLYP